MVIQHFANSEQKLPEDWQLFLLNMYIAIERLEWYINLWHIG
jgi:hypothetical protein